LIIHPNVTRRRVAPKGPIIQLGAMKMSQLKLTFPCRVINKTKSQKKRIKLKLTLHLFSKISRLKTRVGLTKSVSITIMVKVIYRHAKSLAT